MKRPENKFGDEIRTKNFFDPPITNFYIPPQKQFFGTFPYKKYQKDLELHETSRKQVWRRNSKKIFF